MAAEIKLEKFLKERYEKDDLFFQLYDTYTPNFKQTIVTEKFYSKFEKIDFDKADPEMVKAITVAKDKGPKDKYPFPVTGSQWYGWYSELLVPLNRDDRRLYCPKKVSPATKHEIRIRMDKTMELPKFTGVPFRL